jgi:periplasmic divalent cation tolerance protein
LYQKLKFKDKIKVDTMNEMIFVYITNPDKETAKKIAKELLKKRLIACANLYNIESLYWWEGKITEDPEVVLIGKTTTEKFEKVREQVERSHPYTVPCIMQIPISMANESYKNWILEETKGN